VLLGPAVRLSEYVSASDKRYQAVIRLGTVTDTYDGDGQVLSSSEVDISEELFNSELQKFVGEIEQVPPPYSAVKVHGRKAYEMAREGEEVDLAPRRINVYSLELLEWAPPDAVVDVYCSSGTYVRSLAHDLGRNLGCGANLTGLRRTKSGRFTLRDAVPLRKLRDAFQDGTWYQHLIPAADALSDWQSVELTNDQVDAIRHGHRIPGDSTLGAMVRGISEWQPKKVFFS
jgi:tRNA pseudouridine55 synthase